MALTNATLSFNLYRYPTGTDYVARGETDAPADLTTAPSPQLSGRNYNYQGWGLDRWVKPVRVATLTNFINFRMKNVLSGVCDVEVTVEFDNKRDALKLFKEAEKDGTFYAWHLSEPGEADIADDFLSADFSSFISYIPDTAIPRLVDGSDPTGTIPSSFYRGGSGLVEDVDINTTDTGPASITIGGTCWGKQLQETIVRNAPAELAEQQDFGFALIHLFWYNAEYKPALLRDLEDEETEEARYASINQLSLNARQGDVVTAIVDTSRFDNAGNYVGPTTISTDSADDFNAARPVVSPVGEWLLVPLMSTKAREYLTANQDTTYFGIRAGQQSLLRECQRISETAGLVFNTNLPYIIWDVPGSRNTLIWDADNLGQYQMSAQHTRPAATVYVVNHTDELGVETDGSGRNITVHFVDEQAVSKFGEIQRSMLSSAPIYLNDAQAPFAPGVPQTDIEPEATEEQLEDNKWYYNDLHTIRLMEQQALAHAVAESELYTANIDLPYSMGTRYGSDWRLGDLVQLQIDGVDVSDNPLIVRQAGLTIDARGEIRQQCVLGGRGQIQPQWYAANITEGADGSSKKG